MSITGPNGFWEGIRKYNTEFTTGWLENYSTEMNG